MRDVQPKNDSPTGTKEAGSLRYENTRACISWSSQRNAQEPQRCAFFRCGHTLCSVWYQQWNTSTRPLYRWIHVWFSQQRPLSEWIARFFSHPAELLTICHLFSVWLYYDTTLPYASNKHPLLQLLRSIFGVYPQRYLSHSYRYRSVSKTTPRQILSRIGRVIGNERWLVR